MLWCHSVLRSVPRRSPESPARGHASLTAPPALQDAARRSSPQHGEARRRRPPPPSRSMPQRGERLALGCCAMPQIGTYP